MQLENVTAALRPRGQWEAADLGARMIRRDVGAIYKTWFVITLPMLLIALVALYFGASYFWVILIYWWLEPITDGPILHIISRRLFGEATTYREACRVAPQLAWKNRFFWLTPYRLHFARSIALPVVQLEGLRGDARRQRQAILNNTVYNYGVGVTLSYQHLFLSLYFGMALLVFLLVPTQYQDSVGLTWLDQFFEGESIASSMTLLVVAYIAQSSLHPWFVGCGFGLYINRRTELEAWDVEVSFRRMAQRRAAAAALLLAVIVPLAMSPSLSQAQEAAAEDELWSDTEIEEALAAALDRPELQRSSDSMRWRPKDRDEEDSEKPSGAWAGLGLFIGAIAEIGLWLALIVFLIFIFVTRQRWLPYLRQRPPRSAPETAVILADGEVRAEDMPADVPAAVKALWQSGNKRGALGLLYRAAVYHAAHKHGIEIPPSATEGACVQAVVAQAPNQGLAEFFQEVARSWIWCAYGGHDLPSENFLALCDTWNAVYEVRR